MSLPIAERRLSCTIRREYRLPFPGSSRSSTREPVRRRGSAFWRSASGALWASLFVFGSAYGFVCERLSKSISVSDKVSIDLQWPHRTTAQTSWGAGCRYTVTRGDRRVLLVSRRSLEEPAGGEGKRGE